MSNAIAAAVIGASGYAGGELCRLLLQHEHVGTIMVTSRSAIPFEQTHPNLAGCGLEFVTFEAAVAAAKSLDVVFFSTPSGQAMTQARIFLDAGCRVIDLSPDFRFPNAEAYKAVYGCDHVAPDLLGQAVYGATEIYRDRIRDAQLIANPGCYALTCLLGLLPAVRAGVLDFSSDIHVSATNGTTGSSSTPSRETSHVSVANGMLPYSLNGHRHGPEMEYYLSTLAGHSVSLVMNTFHGPFPRGIQAVITAKPCCDYPKPLSRGALTELYLKAYGSGTGGEYFVVVNSFERQGKKNDKEYHLYPNVARLAGSNFCHIGLDYDPERSRVKIVSAIDNLGKGAAGSAVQNMNVMFEFCEQTGLRAFGL
jgi:N-acetyl-gamma-glutamyl-phosphate reductase common form